MFKAILLAKDDRQFQARVADVDEATLPEGDVTLARRVLDASTTRTRSRSPTSRPIVRKWPMVAGIDGAGTVVERARTRRGSPATGRSSTAGAWARATGAASRRRRACKGDWLVRAAAGHERRQAMAIGTAGYTAMLCAMALERLGVTKRSRRGARHRRHGRRGQRGGRDPRRAAATASSPRPARLGEEAYLKALGAAEVIDRKTLSRAGQAAAEGALGRAWSTRSAATRSPTPARRRWPRACVDRVRARAGHGLPGEVAPFILRGRHARRRQQRDGAARAPRARPGARLARELDPAQLESMTCTRSASPRRIARAPDVLAGRSAAAWSWT